MFCELLPDLLLFLCLKPGLILPAEYLKIILLSMLGFKQDLITFSRFYKHLTFNAIE